MKEQELRAHATCSLCRQKIGASGVPLFYRQTGLAMLLGGNGVIAQAMGPTKRWRFL